MSCVLEWILTQNDFGTRKISQTFGLGVHSQNYINIFGVKLRSVIICKLNLIFNALDHDHRVKYQSNTHIKRIYPAKLTWKITAYKNGWMMLNCVIMIFFWEVQFNNQRINTKYEEKKMISNKMSISILKK